MSFLYSLQDVKISLERINEIHKAQDENADGHDLIPRSGPMTIRLEHISFKYDPHALRKTIDDVSIEIPRGK